MKSEIINLTPHVVALYDSRDCEPHPGGIDFAPKPGAMVRAVFVPSGSVARAAQTVKQDGPMDWKGIFSIPVFRIEYGAPEGLPEPREGVRYIVSSLTASAAKASGRDTSDLLVTHSPVRDRAGKIIGCTAFARV